MRIDSLHATTFGRLTAVGIDATLRDAASALSRPGIGLIVVCRNAGAVGVLTKSDLVGHLARGGTADAAVAMLMTRPFVSCRPEDDVWDVWRTMSARRLQNVPVLGRDRRPLGILDIRDAMQALLEHEQYQEQALVNYIAGVGYH